MSTINMLELTLSEILHVINPLREDWETRMQIIEDLRNVVSTIESCRGATVEPFGSFLSQLFTRWGDLDISVELLNGSHIANAAKKHKQTLLGDLQNALRRTGSFRRLQFVLNARVPILKLESKHQNISCDISINNLSGHMKSKFMLWISLIDRRFRDLVLLVKEWAKANHINDSKTGTFNSYSLSLLVIFHFQTCVPPILPPLRDLYHGNVADELIGVRAEVERHIEEIAVANIAKFRKERRVNHSSLSELLTSFYFKFHDINTRAADQGICTYTGQWEDISSNTRWLPKTYAIFIEDPFEQPENTARAVSSNQLTRIGEVFTHTYHRLMGPIQNRNTLIPSLVRPEISRFFPGVLFANIGIDGGINSMSNKKNGYRGNRSSLHFQNSSQVNHRNNGTTHKSQQVSHGKAQAINQQSPESKSASGSQPAKASRQGGLKVSQGLLPLPSQQVQNKLPQTSVSVPRQVNNVVSQWPVKAPQGQAQQVWRPKHSDK